MKQHRHIFPFRWDIKIWVAIAIVLGCIEGAFWSYHDIYEKTPDYALQTLLTAASQGDTTTVSQYVDEDALASQFFESIVQYTGATTPSLMTLNIAWSPLKGDVMSASRDVFHLYVTGQSDSESSTTTYQTFQNRLRSLHFSIPPEGWQYERSHFSHLTGDGTAEITVDFYNTALQATIPVTFTLERGADTLWRITGFANSAQILDAIHGAYEKQLAAKNKPIAQQIASVITIDAVSAQLLGTPPNTQRFLRLSYTPSFHVDRETIEDIKGTYTLRRADDKAVLYSADIRLSTAGEKDTYVTQFLLNPLIPSQYQLSQRDSLDGTTSTLTVTSVHLKDGTEYTLATQVHPVDASQQ